jgi:hypothetical protein
MPEAHTFLPVNVTREQQSEISTMSTHRLDMARERIDAVCTEYNHFNPTCSIPGFSSSTISCAEADPERRFLSPDPDQLKVDLQALFERFLALESVAADNAYRRISLHAWEAASDEYGSFDWEKLKEIIGFEVEEVNEHGYCVDLSDLVTLRTKTACL